MGYIYLITNKINNKKYIGQTTKTIKERWQQHCYDALNQRDDFYLHKAIRKYGIENFTVLLIKLCNDIDLDKYEIENIALYNTYYIYNQGYNLTRGGQGYTKVNEDLILKQWNEGKSSGLIANYFGFYIRTITDVLKKHDITQQEIYSRSMKYGSRYRNKKIFQYDLSGNLINVYSSLNHMHLLTGYRKDYISAACRHQYSSANGYLWIYENELEDIQSLLDKIPKITNYPVLQYDKLGKFIAEYPSYRSAAKAMGCTVTLISKAVKNPTYTAKGFYWKNKDDTSTINLKIIAHNNIYNDRKKKVAQMDKNNNILQIFNSIQDAANAVGKPSCRSGIGKVCQGKQQTSCGFKWAYVET